MSNENRNKKAGWNFDNSYARLPDIFFVSLIPEHVPSPKCIIFNHSLAEALGLNPEVLESKDGVEVLAGNQIPEGALPIAQAYAGHQFGHFTMLGDGRALLLGEQITPSGERFDIQFKGSGKTPFSRGGDGKAVLGPMLREYIISEAMHALDIPTTRSLAVVTTGESILRESYLPGAILTRVAASHLRVGTFQYVSQWGTNEELRILADYTIQRHFPEIDAADSNRYLMLLKGVIGRQAMLIAKWQLVGFVHGVMNTDNMTISGETIDYGPCAFMDTYNLKTVFSSIDLHGRYAYGNQPSIAQWNITRFARTLLPLIDGDHNKAIDLAQNEISNFSRLYHNHWLKGMRAKLGLSNEEQQDEALIENLLNMMQKYQADYTNTFRAFTIEQLHEMDLFNSSEFKQWYKQWQDRLNRQKKTKSSFKQLMQRVNPAVIPRNHRVEEALKASVENGDYSVMRRLLHVLSEPYAYSPEQVEYATIPSNCSYRTFCGT